MHWRRFKYIYLGLLMVFIFSSGVSFYWMAKSQPQKKPKSFAVQQPIEEVFQISKDTKVVIIDRNEICQKYNLKCSVQEKELTGPSREQINYLTFEELQNKLHADNKTVEIKNNVILITTLIDGLCSEHKKILHLGVNNRGEYVTVYYGPGIVKNEGGVYKVTEIPVDQLPQKYQEKVRIHAMEFTEEEELIATLDSFSE